MAVDPINGYYQCWYPWTGRYTGQSRPMSYWIQFPNPEAEMPVGGWPVLIMLQGGSYAATGFSGRVYHTYKTPTTGGATVEIWNPGTAGSPYFEYPAICILPDISDYDEWLLAKHYYTQRYEYKTNYYNGQFAGVPILRKIIEDLIAGTLSFYDDSSCTTEWADFSNPTVDSDRVYASGYSYGGGAIMALCRDMRDILAAVVMGAGWPIGNPYRDHYAGGEHYDPDLSNALCRIVERNAHIPIVCHAGQDDNMYKAMSGLLRCYEDVIGNKHNLRLAYDVGQGHSGGWAGWTAWASHLFDADNRNAQAFQSSGSGLVHLIEWLFYQTKPETPEDPYPTVIEGDNGFFRSYGYDFNLSTKTFTLSQATGELETAKVETSFLSGISITWASGLKIQANSVTILQVGESATVTKAGKNHFIRFVEDKGDTVLLQVESPRRYIVL